MTNLNDQPFTFSLPFDTGSPSRVDNHITRHLSSMKGQYLDEEAYNKKLTNQDILLYEVYEIKRPETAGELLHGVSVVHPGLVGDEYFMTKGHFHSVLDTSEIYYCLKGQGVMVMETPEGDWSVKELLPGMVLYVPPRWAHRSVNTGLQEDLVTFFIYPGHSGHDYSTIAKQGFRKLIVSRDGKPTIIDNPRWLSPEERE